jgi:transcriptional repressor NrdR
MQCPKCKSQETKVLESRDASGPSTRRRRECISCANRFTTYERVERPNIAVIKRDGTRELFSRNKVLEAVDRSIGKFFNSNLEIEELVSDVEDAIYSINEPEIKSKKIGQVILDVLADKNKVAYIRFASVYNNFTCLEDFEKALDRVRSEG